MKHHIAKQLNHITAAGVLSLVTVITLNADLPYKPLSVYHAPTGHGTLRRTAPGQLEGGDPAQPAAPKAKAPKAVTYSIPPNAKPGECYVQVIIPAVYETVSEKVLVKQASSRIETLPPEYEWVEEKVLVKPASKRLEVVPAAYKTVEEKMLVKAAAERLVEVPAVYDTVTEEVLVKPASVEWKAGRGPLEKVDNSTGEIVCLVETPAEYKTVTRTVVKTPASTRKEVIPAEYKTVKKTVMTKEPTTRAIEIPAEYETVRVQRLKTAASQKLVTIPAEYATVTRKVLKSAATTDWRRIICETNINPQIISDLQAALTKAGTYKGAVDGRLTPATLTALESYQRSKGLATGGITIESMSALGIDTK